MWKRLELWIWRRREEAAKRWLARSPLYRGRVQGSVPTRDGEPRVVWRAGRFFDRDV